MTMVESRLTSEDHSKLRRYHAVQSTASWPDDVARIDRRFRGNHKVADGSAIATALDVILEAHRARVAGEGSPAACDEAARRAAA